MSEPTCPKCGSATWHYVEILGEYDGALYCQCDDCGRAFHRFSEGHFLRDRAEKYVALVNGGRS